jgi:hypothetical protein
MHRKDTFDAFDLYHKMREKDDKEWALSHLERILEQYGFTY